MRQNRYFGEGYALAAAGVWRCSSGKRCLSAWPNAKKLLWVLRWRDHSFAPVDAAGLFL